MYALQNFLLAIEHCFAFPALAQQLAKRGFVPCAECAEVLVQMGDQRRKLVRDGGQVQHIQTRPKQFVYAGDAGHILKAAARKARKTLRGGTFDIGVAHDVRELGGICDAAVVLPRGTVHDARKTHLCIKLFQTAHGIRIRPFVAGDDHACAVEEVFAGIFVAGHLLPRHRMAADIAEGAHAGADELLYRSLDAAEVGDDRAPSERGAVYKTHRGVGRERDEHDVVT